jgi:hypothetical protein
MTDTANAGAKQRPHRFQPGVSGNPKGKAPGTRHKTTMAVEALLDGEAERLTRKAIEMALAGDGLALRLCLERFAPPRRDRPVAFDLGPISTAGDATRAMAALVMAVADGNLTPSEATELGKLVDGFTRAIEAGQFEERLVRLEEATRK